MSRITLKMNLEKEAEFEPKKEMQIECFRITRYFGSQMYQCFFMKIYLVLLLLMHGSSQIIQTYLFIYKLSVKEVIQYGPAYFGPYYGILGTLVALIKPRIIEDMHKEIQLWSIDSGNESTRIKIKKEMKIIEAFAIFNILVLVMYALALSTNTETTCELFLQVKLVHERFPKYSKIYSLFIFTVLPTVYALPSFQIIYYTQHMKYQMLMLADHVKEITTCPKEYYVKVIHPIENLSHQAEIKRRLIYVIKRHQELLKQGIKTVDELRNIFIGFTLCGILAGIAVLVLAVSIINQTSAITAYKQNITLVDYFEAGIAFVATTTTAASLIAAGQSIENSTDEFHEIVQQIDWYDMNCENRKIYLIFLIGTMNKISIKFSDQYSVNYALGLGIAKTIYSIASVLVNFRKN